MGSQDSEPGYRDKLIASWNSLCPERKNLAIGKAALIQLDVKEAIERISANLSLRQNKPSLFSWENPGWFTRP